MHPKSLNLSNFFLTSSLFSSPCLPSSLHQFLSLSSSPLHDCGVGTLFPSLFSGQWGFHLSDKKVWYCCGYKDTVCELVISQIGSLRWEKGRSMMSPNLWMNWTFNSKVCSTFRLIFYFMYVWFYGVCFIYLQSILSINALQKWFLTFEYCGFFFFCKMQLALFRF